MSSSSSAASSAAMMKGYLSKEGKVVHSIKKRYFQLWANPPFFSYYEKQGGAHIKTVSIEGADNHVMINPTKPNAFYLLTGDRKWSFMSESGSEMSAWVRHLTEACDDARRRACPRDQTKEEDGQSPLRVLVAGVGSAACAAAVLALVKHHPEVRVRAFVNLNTIVASFLPALANVEMVHIDSDDPRTLEDAFSNVDTLIADFPHDRSIETALAYIGAATRANLKLFCVLIPPVSGLTPHVFSQYRQIERDLKASSLSFCMLRTNHLIDLQLGQIEALRERKTLLSPPIGDDVKISWVSSFDVGVCAAAVAVAPGSHEEKRYSVTGRQAFTYADLAEIYSKLMGEEISVTKLSENDFLAMLMRDKNMTRWAAEGVLELFTQADRFLEYCSKEREESKKASKSSDAKKASVRRKITPYELSGMNTDFETLSEAKRCDVPTFLDMLHARFLSGRTEDNKTGSEWVLPLLATRDDDSLLPPPPPFSFEDLAEEPSIDEKESVDEATGATSPRNRPRSSSMSKQQDRISIPTSVVDSKGVQMYNIKIMKVQQTIPKRFSAFHEFAKEIKRRFPDVHYPDLPGKSVFSSTQTVERRRVDFQAFLVALVNQEKVWPELSKFLGVNLQEALGRRFTNIRTVRAISRSASRLDVAPTAKTSSLPTMSAVGESAPSE